MRQRVDAITFPYGTWGFAVVRTYFGDDAKFTKAIQVIYQLVADYNARDLFYEQKHLDKAIAMPKNFPYAPVSVDTEPNDQFMLRFRLDLLQDQSLENATAEQVRLYFTEWRRFLYEQHSVSLDHDPRYKACIMLDRETMEMMAALPDRLDDIPPRHDYCIKMVEAFGQDHTEPFLVHIKGVDNLIDYWFSRLYLQRELFEITGYANESEKRVLYYGALWKIRPQSPTPLWQQAAQDGLF